MSNKIDKPKQTAPQLITKMKSKGITFKYITEEKAAEYLTRAFQVLCKQKKLI